MRCFGSVDETSRRVGPAAKPKDGKNDFTDGRATHAFLTMAKIDQGQISKRKIAERCSKV